MNQATSSAGRSILRGMLWVSGFVLLAKLAGALKEMAVAASFGTGALIDTYLLAFNLATFPVSIALSVVSIVLVPLVARLAMQRADEVALFRAELLGLTILTGAAISVILFVVSPWALETSLPTGPVVVVWPLWLLVPFGMVSSVLASWLMAGQRHVNTLFEALPSLVLLAVLLLVQGGGASLIWGTLGGFILQTLSLAFVMWKAKEIEFPCFSLKSSVWPSFRRGFGIMLAGQAVMAAVPLVDQIFAGSLGEGAIASLGYSNRVLGLLMGLGATTLSRASLPVLSVLSSDTGLYLRRVQRWLLLLVGASMFAVSLAWIFAPNVVEILFERGEFLPSDTEAVADVLRWSLFQLPFYFAGVFLVAALAALGRHHAVALVAFVSLAVKLVANTLLVGFSGLEALVISTALMYAASAACYYFLLVHYGNTTRRS